MRPLLVLRPEPGNAETMARTKTRGLNAFSFPLFVAEPIAWAAPPTDQFDEVLLTSANAIRLAGDGLQALKGLPAYCVGEATADVARNAGFTIAKVGQSGVNELLASVGEKRLIHLCGEDRIAPKPSVTAITPLPCYRMVAPPVQSKLLEALAQNPIALLHSPRAARHFSALVDASTTPRSAISLYTLSHAIADAVGEGWEDVAISPHPRDEEALQAAIVHFKLTLEAN